MSKKTRIIPFSWLPASWGLSGKTRQIAEIEYYYDGEERDRAIASLEEDEIHRKIKLLGVDKKYRYISNYEYEKELTILTMSGKEKDLALLEIEKEHNKISESEYKEKYLKLTLSGKELELELAKLDLENGKIKQNEYEKTVATINGEPWVNVVSLEPGLKGVPGQIELDWNDIFIERLREEGYKGADDDDIANAWLTNLCKIIAIEEFGGVGEFDEQLEDAEYKRNNNLGDDYREVR